MTLTKAHLMEALFAKNIFTKTESAQIIDTLFELIKQSLQKCALKQRGDLPMSKIGHRKG